MMQQEMRPWWLLPGEEEQEQDPAAQLRPPVARSRFDLPNMDAGAGSVSPAPSLMRAPMGQGPTEVADSGEPPTVTAGLPGSLPGASMAVDAPAPPPDMMAKGIVGPPKAPPVMPGDASTPAAPPDMEPGAMGRDPRYRAGLVAAKEAQDDQAAPAQSSRFGAGPLAQAHLTAAQKYAELAGKKTPLWQSILQSALTRDLRPLTQNGRLGTAERQVKALGGAAEEERKQQANASGEELKLKQMELLDEEKRNALAARANTVKSGPLTMTDRIREAMAAKGPDGQPLYTPDEIKMIGAGWKPPVEKAERFSSSPQGIYNTSTGKVETPAPPKEVAERENPNQWVADSLNPDPAISAPAKAKIKTWEGTQKNQRPSINVQFTPPAALDKAAPGSVTIDQVPDAIRGRVQQVLDYRGDYPSSSRNNPANQAIAYWANKIDPSLDAGTFKARQKIVQSYGPAGTQGQNLTALNTAITHLGGMADSVAGLDNTPFRKWNTFGNWLANESGSPQTKPFENYRTAFVEEMARALKGGVATEKEVAQWMHNIDTADSPAALKVSTKTVADIIKGRILNQEDSYSREMEKPPKASFITPRSQAVLDKLSGGGQPAGGAQGGMIKVRRKSDGQPGSIPAANFNPDKYEKI